MNIGDRVELNSDWDPLGTREIIIKSGDKGEIRSIIMSYGLPSFYGVRFDNPFPAGHDLNGECDPYHGYYVILQNLTIAKPVFIDEKL